MITLKVRSGEYLAKTACGSFTIKHIGRGVWITHEPDKPRTTLDWYGSLTEAKADIAQAENDRLRQIEKQKEGS